MTTSVTPSPTPRKAASATYPAVGLAMGLIALGAVAVRDAVLAAGWISGTPWIPPAVHVVDGLAPAAWTVVAGAGAALVGVALVITAVAPRRRRGVPVDADTAVYVELTDVARLASAAAEQTPGVISARTSAGRRSVTVRCRVTGPVDRDAVVADVTTVLSGLSSPPRVRVETTREDPS
ncbi:hypothetical protein A5757_17240 [Mycobacterium sp. 852013-51886_SCH5428379]|uniref:DUF6286 domain-containing protein n=1 Tax=Mycobacterium sp. 852013-51886_SCH5428379 TaxID=1834111 RepID=UPI0007FB765E|nr:DUF6286 domain-containing protein [Mycobacterium sp. 852013-51886_SCH5428379]OBB58240.1 hypothetical protein A5757_17240 [Mycobacterium sp. 852013-51886_SCH5428379]